MGGHVLKELATQLEELGLVLRGGFYKEAPNATTILIGNVGSQLWKPFANEIDWSNPHPLDHWTKLKLDPIANTFKAKVIYPFVGPDYAPFQTWAMKADCVYPSPVGPLIHPDYGLWHAYRAAFTFEGQLADLSNRDTRPSPCEACVEKPCISACPVHAFDEGNFDASICMDHISSKEGIVCAYNGCRSRLACPVGEEYSYCEEQMRFHMKKYLRADI